MFGNPGALVGNQLPLEVIVRLIDMVVVGRGICVIICLAVFPTASRGAAAWQMLQLEEI